MNAACRQAASRLHGTFHAIVADFLPPGPDDVLRVLERRPRAEVILLGPGLPIEDSIRLASLFDLQYPEISVVLVTDK